MLFEIPDAVKNTAKFGLSLVEQGYPGGKQLGRIRGLQLSTKNFIRLNDIRVIRNWFARHIYTSYPSYKRWIESEFDKNKISPGVVSYLLWGGDASFDLVNSQQVLNSLNNTYNTDYKVIQKP
jgi:hypothetical protein